AVLAVMLVAATALATEDAFADKKRHDDKKKGGYGKSQAVSQVNDCGNGELPLNVWCQNTASQIQGEGNYVATGSAQGSLEEENGNGVDMQQNAEASTDQQASVEE
ncbi:MAG: hypothetical protein ACRD8Z_20770, partial [Nitrososphaeraceae archaeon]